MKLIPVCRLSCCLLLLVACHLAAMAQPKSPSLPGPMIWFDEARHDFGELIQGSQVSHTFKVTNFGDQPIVFTSVKTTCGCDYATVPQPIAPGETGEITYHYDGNRIGRFSKNFVAQSNAVNDPHVIVRLEGEILPMLPEESVLAPSESISTEPK